MLRKFDESEINFLSYRFIDIGYSGNTEPITPRKCNFGYLSEKIVKALVQLQALAAPVVVIYSSICPVVLYMGQ